MREHYHNLQALRGVACLLVIGMHLWVREVEFGVQTPIFRVIQWFGFAGVDLFFVLSGFLIASTNRKYLGQPSAVPSYLFRRAWRIYPTYWVTMAISASYICAISGEDELVRLLGDSWPRWVLLIPDSSENVLVGQAWTLSYEILFYAAFGLLFVLPARWAAIVLGAWAAAVAIALAFPEPQSPLAALPTSPFVLEFLGGCAISELANRGIRGRWRSALALGIAWPILAILLMTAASSESYISAISSHRIRVLVFGPAAILLVYGMSAAEGRWPRQVPRWLLRIGDASYSLYLLHPTVLASAMWVGVLVPHSRLSHTLWLLGTFGGVLACGLLMHRLIEKPLLNLLKRKKKPPTRTTEISVPERQTA